MNEPYLGPDGVKKLWEVIQELNHGVGHGLKVVEGDLTVDAVDSFAAEDKTLPMTAAGVESVVGNIDVLLGTI